MGLAEKAAAVCVAAMMDINILAAWNHFITGVHPVLAAVNAVAESRATLQPARAEDSMIVHAQEGVRVFLSQFMPCVGPFLHTKVFALQARLQRASESAGCVLATSGAFSSSVMSRCRSW